MSGFYILFRHNAPGAPSTYSIRKEYDDGKIWDSPLYEVVEYFDSPDEARRFLKTMKEGAS